MNPQRKNHEHIARRGLMRCIQTWKEDEMIIEFCRLRGADGRLEQLAQKLESNSERALDDILSNTPDPEWVLYQAFTRQKGTVSILTKERQHLFSARASFAWFKETILTSFTVACPLNPEKDSACEGKERKSKKRSVSFQMLASKNGISLEDLKKLRDLIST